jgi:hypothetical protein
LPKGGRGGKRRGGGGGQPNWSKSPNPYQIPATLSEAIGKQGAPKSMSEAWFDSNPYYSPNYAEFSENCQRCVMAYEMRRRGYDVEALPTYETDTMPQYNEWTKALSGMTTVDVGRTTERGTIGAIERQMSEWGEGARAILRIKWAGSNRGGHVINVEYKNGKLNAYDVQVARDSHQNSAGGKELLKEYMQYTTLSRTQLLRTDNAKITDNMRFMVKKK